MVPSKLVAKRSPILGYNHNVRYRGLVFHVQTEDSGVLSPHLFTHLFHGGVIVSTRKLVYDAGSNEEAIKALMQAQHKAVMKDLRKGAFDDKIDEYLGGTPGLEPRGADSVGALASARAKTDADPSPLAVQPAASSEIPAQKPPEAVLDPNAQTIPNIGPPAAARTPTPAQVTRVPTPAQAPRIATPPPASAKSTHPRASTPPPIPPRPVKQPDPGADSNPVIEISVDDDSSARSRQPRDTAVEEPRIGGDSIPPLPPVPEKRGTPSLGAATLPPVARPAQRPPSRPAIQTPTVVSRPVQDEQRNRRDSDVIEVYAPAPPSVEPPPGARAESRGQYSVSRGKHEASGDVPMREQTGRLATIPSGLPRPRLGSGRTPPVGSAVPDSGRRPMSEPATQRTQPSPQLPAPPPQPAPQAAAPPRQETQPQRSRTPTPARVPHVTTPLSSRTGSPGSPGVVMSRPAVIVGAPKPQPTGQQRVRKAREDEGRGFGQGLISEKSLDEVILAYLSEDAEDNK